MLKPVRALLKKFPICHGNTLVRWCSAVVGTVLHSYFLLTHVVATALEVIPLTMLGDLVPGIFLPEPQALRPQEVVNSQNTGIKGKAGKLHFRDF